MKLSGFLRLAVWLIVLVMLGWVLTTVPIHEALKIVSTLKIWNILVLIALNLLIVWTFSSRWWLILRSQGFYIPYMTLAGYRLSGFGLSYFTPGPQIGGEPLQVHLLNNRQQVPLSSAVASVTLDKIVELLVNFTGLVVGVMILITSNLLNNISPMLALMVVIGLLFVPLIYIILIIKGVRPMARIICSISKYPFLRKACDLFGDAEQLVANFCIEKPKMMIGGVIIGIFVWGLMITEFWFTIGFLGLKLSLVETMIVWTAARLAFLLPIPGGLGGLEASQLIAMQFIGADPVLGISLSIIIRMRDVLIAGSGLLLGAHWTQRGMIAGEAITKRYGSD